MQQARVIFLRYAGTCKGCQRYLAQGAKALFKRGHIVGCYDCAAQLRPKKVSEKKVSEKKVSIITGQAGL